MDDWFYDEGEAREEVEAKVGIKNPFLISSPNEKGIWATEVPYSWFWTKVTNDRAQEDYCSNAAEVKSYLFKLIKQI